jgi:hypothetical protein
MRSKALNLDKALSYVDAFFIPARDSNRIVITASPRGRDYVNRVFSQSQGIEWGPIPDGGWPSDHPDWCASWVIPHDHKHDQVARLLALAVKSDGGCAGLFGFTKRGHLWVEIHAPKAN